MSRARNEYTGASFFPFGASRLPLYGKHMWERKRGKEGENVRFLVDFFSLEETRKPPNSSGSRVVIRIRINPLVRTNVESERDRGKKVVMTGFVVYGWFSRDPRHTGSKRDYHKGCTLNPELSLHRTALRVEVILEIHETVTPSPISLDIPRFTYVYANAEVRN